MTKINDPNQTDLESVIDQKFSNAWLIFNRERGMYWRSNETGYTLNIREAGRYTLEDAQRLCRDSQPFNNLSPIEEVIVPAPEFLAWFKRPIDIILHCPSCERQHIDRPFGSWKNHPHKSHLCESCGCIWRPSDRETNGVAEIHTRGKDDTFTYGKCK